VAVFLDMRHKKKIVTPEGVDDLTPFGVWKPPHIPMTPQEHYRPLTRGRMGYMLVFDANDSTSWDEAQRIHIAFKTLLEQNTKTQIRPIIYFIANKIDKTSRTDEITATTTKAEQYCQQQSVRLMKVSALKAKNVKRAFYDLMRIVVGNEVLWEIEWEQEEDDDDDDEEPPFCAQS